MQRRLLALTLFSAMLIASLAATVSAHDGYEFMDRLDAARDAGDLSVDDVMLYKFYYVFDHAKLPSGYQPLSYPPLKCATPLVQEFEKMRGDLQSSTVATIDNLLAPNEGGNKAQYISPGGNFRLTYETTGGNAVPSADTDPANGIPDFVDNCAEYLDYSWSYEVGTLGYQAPPVSPYYEIDFEDMSAYGVTTVVSGYTTRITLENDFIGFPPNDDPEGDVIGAAKVTCAHEFKHASQRPTSSWTEGGWVELDATWMEDIVYDVVNDYYNYLPSGNGITSPNLSLDDGGTGSYEDCIWQHWMSETYGLSIMYDFWEWRRTNMGQAVLSSYNSILVFNGSNMPTAYGVFGGWNYACGSRSIAGIGYGEAATYPNSQATFNSTYPYVGSGTLDHLASQFIHNTSFSMFDLGVVHIDFDAVDGIAFNLTAIIKKNDGTGVVESITLDGTNSASVDLSVPLNEIATVGIAITNTASVGTNKAWDITISKVIDLPDPTADFSLASLDLELDIDATGPLALTLSNNGEPTSVLAYDVYLMQDDPLAKATTAKPRELSVPARKIDKPVPDLEKPLAYSSDRYSGDCIFGNTDFDNILGHYTDWWYGNEIYAYAIDPADYVCSCGAGFNVRAVHMLLALDVASTPSVQAHLMTSSGTCGIPDTIIDSSAVMAVSGITELAYYDIEIATDFVCTDMDGEYFLAFEFLDSNGPVYIPVDTTPQACVNYNEWGEGWKEIVTEYGFQGDLFIWGDVDCCGTALPEVSVIQPNGGELVSAGSLQDIQWTATVVTDVKIDLSRNNGGAWEPVLATTTNDGTETVTITGPASEECLVRVSTLDDLYFDVSDAVFTIYDTIPWLSVDIDNGDIAMGDDDLLTFTFDATGLAEGVYTGYVMFVSNALSSPDVLVATLTVNDPGVGVDDAPHVFSLRGNYPNPFNPVTKVNFVMPEAGLVTVDVLDLQGRVVRTLISEHVGAGPASAIWDGTDSDGRQVASGTYMARVRFGDRIATHKMTLTK
jgi:hypothetical protein